MQGFADRIVEMRPERVDRNALAGDVLDALDGTVFQDMLLPAMSLMLLMGLSSRT
jgi:hypothetical protein